MRAYLVTTAVVFGLLVVAHIWRMIEEGPAVATDPVYLLTTAAAAGLCGWAWRLLRSSARS
jgi:hypothetical protein